MFEIIFLFVLALIWTIFALVQDLRTTEIANWLNFSLIFFAMGFRLFYSLFEGNGLGFFYQGLIGLAIFFVLGNLLYSAKMFAGGDAKMFFSFGAILPVSERIMTNIEGFLLFMLIFFIIGAAYTLAVTVALSINNSKAFRKEIGKQFRERKQIVNIVTALAIIIGLVGLFADASFFYLAIFVLILPYLYLYTKAVDEAAMIYLVSPEKLMEGDWLYKDVKVGRRVIRATWDGLSKKEMLLLKKHKKKVWIRRGVQFTSTFLISLLFYFYFLFIGLGNPFW